MTSNTPARNAFQRSDSFFSSSRYRRKNRGQFKKPCENEYILYKRTIYLSIYLEIYLSIYLEN